MRRTCCSETSRLESWRYPLHSGGITRPVAHCTIGKLSRAEFESLGKTHGVKRDHKRNVSYATSSVRRKGWTDESGDRPLGAQITAVRRRRGKSDYHRAGESPRM